uniref:Frizzled-1-like n=1 Tax=Sinocyclocheilus grahami TaxID=75366 RepID=A0A672P829_SINGR
VLAFGLSVLSRCVLPFNHSMFTCESIGLRMCQDLPYNTTFMPNLLNHYDQQTAALAMEVTMLFLLSYTAGI